MYMCVSFFKLETIVFALKRKSFKFKNAKVLNLESKICFFIDSTEINE